MKQEEKINLFAKKWHDRFQNAEDNYLEFTEPRMGEECRELGFEMDCGKAFMDIYGDAINDENALIDIIDSIDDIFLLGSAIYSKWRYFNHWAYSGAEILESGNRMWFIIALKKLASLTKG